MVLLFVLVLGAVAFIAYGWKPTLAAVAKPDAAQFDPALVARGGLLARAGNCASCHTAPSQAAYAGGVPIDTPFGTIYGTNITPDPETGIGHWSEAAFRRAMREGVDREGRHLYPAFPYDHFTRVTDDDDRALYAFLMTRTPVRADPPRNELPFPLNIRMLLAGWKLLFFHPGAWQPDATRDPAWNRGAYLVEGLGHCSACHSPRNALGAERAEAHLGGGMAEGWNAYALNAASPAPIPWTVDTMAAYLGRGWAEHHGVSRGPMAAVTANLAALPESDRTAMGTYLVGLMGVPSPERRNRARKLLDTEVDTIEGASAGTQIPTSAGGAQPGAGIFAAACASCHSGLRPLPFGGLNLAMSTALQAPDPSNVIIVTLNGLPAAPGEPSAIMPGFAGALDDRQIADLLTYLRTAVAGQKPWPDLETTIRNVRTRALTLRPSDGTTGAPDDPHVKATGW